MDFINPQYIVNALLFSVIGIAVFWLSFLIIDKFTPYSLWKEIVEEKSIALAIVVASVCLSIAIIVASAIHG